MNRHFVVSWILFAGFLQVANATSVGTNELADAHAWAAAKFQGIPEAPDSKPGLFVLANHDPVQKNSRGGKPLRIATTEYPRGLYCHAYSKLLVRLPSPGRRFTALVGVDSNEQTSGGRGSVDFSVTVGEQERFRSGLVREGVVPKAVSVELGGATEFQLLIDPTADGISCDQSDWAEAKVTLTNGQELWLADLPLVERERPPFSTELPFSFNYDGKPATEVLKDWVSSRTTKALDSNRNEHVLKWIGPDLEVRCSAIEYRDFPTVEWTVHFTNIGNRESAVVSEIQALDTAFDPPSSSGFVLHHNKGTFVRADDFEPLTTPLQKQPLTFTPPAGRPCGAVWPYFNLESTGQGVIIVVGWPGQWSARFEPQENGSCRVIAGQELTHLKLQPGESVRTPLIALQFWEGDWLRSQNIWRRWMLAHNLPKQAGRIPSPILPACSSHQFGEMINANEQNQKLFIDRYLAEGLKIDYWWMDAGWYVNQSGWPNTGTWLVDSNRFPNGLRAITDHGRTKGVRSLVWFEPERVTPGTWLHEKHPEWLLKDTLLDLGNTNAWNWLVEHIDKTIVEQGIDLYRQDYNIDPLRFWRETDTPDRQGVTENHYVTGYLAYWDELRRRHPDMLIDSCASGGHRNDLETMRRSLPFLRSDFIQDAVGNQGHTYGLSLWLPYHGTGTDQLGTYELRSAMACPHFIACWDVRDPKLDYDHLRRMINQWRSFSEYYYGDYYPLTPHNLAADQWLAWQFDRPETRQGMVQAFRRDRSVYESARFKLQGLVPDARYSITNLDATDGSQESTGHELMEIGLRVPITTRPGTATILYKQL